MNDSAFGELVAAGAKEGEDFGSTPFPGTDDSFLAVVDVFVAATKAKNAKNALAFLAGISEPSTQLAFNAAKGSVPVVRDVDVSSLTAYQRAVLEGPVVGAGAALDRARRGDEPGVPGGLLRRGLDLRPDPEHRRVRRRPRRRGLQGQDPPALNHTRPTSLLRDCRPAGPKTISARYPSAWAVPRARRPSRSYREQPQRALPPRMRAPRIGERVELVDLRIFRWRSKYALLCG